MDSYVYVEPVNTNLVCSLSAARTPLTPPRQPFVDPTTATPCGHTFCRTCIDQALDVSPHCPIDRGALAHSDLLPAPQLVRNMVDELLVHCPNAPLGCTHTSQRQLISSHACTHTPVPCAHPSCPESVLEHHRDAPPPESDTCPHKLVKCQACGLVAPAPEHPDRCPARSDECPHCLCPVPHNRLAEHAANECAAVPVACPMSVYGCAYTGPSGNMHRHLSDECAFERLKPFLAVTQARVASLERTVSELKQQLDATKKSLGPWYRPVGAPPSTEPEPPRFEFRPLVGRRRVSSPLHTSMFNLDDEANTSSGATVEVGSMRAIVHGLRMQVSALVMERNVAMIGRMRTSTAGGTTTTERASSNAPDRNDGERWATETRYYNQHPPPPVNLAVPYSVRRQETNNKL
ncbi:hypothetical protein FRC11_000034 [Ceratobasidium sp. 423]|nr:hypothetical protein FRC11_000034 [Ceratobasidium sp. 423]